MNFIVRYDNVLPEEVIGKLTSVVDQNISYSSRSDSIVKDKQLSLEVFWPELASEINQSLLNRTLKDNLDKYR